MSHRASYGPFELKPYQTEAAFTGGVVAGSSYPGVHGAFEKSDSAILTMATGTGKTVVMGALAAHEIERGGRVLILASRRKLIHQGTKTFEAIGLSPRIEMAGRKVKVPIQGGLFDRGEDADLVVASVSSLSSGSKKGQKAQSIKNLKRLKKFPRNYFTHVYVDECHHATSGNHLRPLDYFSSAKRLGVTATPDRADGKNLGSIFKVHAYDYPLHVAISNGHLKEIRIRRIETGIDMSSIRISGSDYTDKQLSRLILPRISDLAHILSKHINGRKVLVFTPCVQSAKYMAEALTKYGNESRFVSYKFDPTNNLEDFRRDCYSVLVGNEMLTEGYDEPSVDTIALLRPTRSRSKYAQMIGRGTRIDLRKPYNKCLILDFAFLSEKHEEIHIVNLFDDGSLPSNIIEYAKTLVDSGMATSPSEAVNEARNLYLERKRSRLLMAEYILSHTVYEYNPFEAWTLLDRKNNPSHDLVHPWNTPAKQWQVDELESYGIMDGASLSYRGAQNRIDELRSRKQKGLASLVLVGKLKSIGIDHKEAVSLTTKDAVKVLAKALAESRNHQ